MKVKAPIIHESMDLPIDELIFDPENPRLPESIDSSNEADVIDWMIRKTSLLDLVSSISENGYFPGEPLLVVRVSETPKKYIVVEGNRRLASLKLIKKPILAAKRKKSLDNILERGEGKVDFKKIPVIRFDDRDDILNYLGYRHVTGTKSWSPLAKSKYLFELRKSKLYKNVPSSDVYYELAYSIGSKGHYVKKFIACYELFLKLVKANFFSRHDLDVEEIEYSNFYDALSKNNIALYVGLDFDEDEPSQGVSLSRLKEVAKLLYVKDSLGATALGESRNISKMNDIFSDDKAIKAFVKEGKSINEALLLIDTAESRLGTALLNITHEIDLVRDVFGEIKNSLNDYTKSIEVIEKFISKIKGL